MGLSDTSIIWGTFDLVGIKVILGSFYALVSHWPVSPIEQNGVKIGTHGYPVGFKVILGSFGVLSFKMACNSKGMVAEQNGVKCATRGYYM